jgi:hypothetical protein
MNTNKIYVFYKFYLNLNPYICDNAWHYVHVKIRFNISETLPDLNLNNII